MVRVRGGETEKDDVPLGTLDPFHCVHKGKADIVPGRRVMACQDFPQPLKDGVVLGPVGGDDGHQVRGQTVTQDQAAGQGGHEIRLHIRLLGASLVILV